MNFAPLPPSAVPNKATPAAFKVCRIKFSDSTPSQYQKGGALLPGVDEGYGICFLRKASTPGVRLKLTVNGAVVPHFSPGDKITGYFQGAKWEREDNSPFLEGDAYLLVILNPNCSFDEAAVEAELPGVVELPQNNLTVTTYPTALAKYAVLDATGAKNAATLRTEGKRGAANADVSGWRRVFVDLLTAPGVIPAPQAMTTIDVRFYLQTAATFVEGATPASQTVIDTNDPNVDVVGFAGWRLFDSDRTAVDCSEARVGFFLDLDGNENYLSVKVANKVGGGADSAVAVRIWGVNK